MIKRSADFTLTAKLHMHQIPSTKYFLKRDIPKLCSARSPIQIISNKNKDNLLFPANFPIFVNP